MTIQEIEEFVQGELSYLNLTTVEQKRIIRFIMDLDYHYKVHNKEYLDTTTAFLNKLEDCLEFFKLQGFDDEKALEFAKRAVISYGYKDFKEKLAFLRVSNLEETVIMNDTLSLRLNLKKAHAIKMHLVSQNDKASQTKAAILHSRDENISKRFNVGIDELLEKYPLSKETIEVWMIIATMKDNEFEEYFKISREKLSYIYPTTKEELTILNFIANLTDEDIMERYGITREALLEKHPLKKDTLSALKSIKGASDKAIQNTFNQSREEVLQLRTITTEMIKLAQKKKVSLKVTPSTKDKSKVIKKGTHPNG